jgi:integrase
MASGPHFDRRRGSYTIQWFDGRRWTRATVCKIPHWKPGSPRPKKDPPEARAALKTYADRERAARQNRPAEPARTVADFLTAYRVAYAREQARGSVLQLDQVHRNFLAWCEAKKIRTLEDVTPSTCQGYLEHRASMISRKTKQPISPKRLVQERGLLSGAWTRAVRLREMPTNPWGATQAPGWDRERRRKVRRPSWSPEQFAALHAAARPWLRDLLTLGVQTGIRISALLGLEWRDVEWATGGPGFGLIRVRPEADKAGRGYAVPMSRTAHDMLARRFAGREAHARSVLTAARGGKIRVSVADRAIRAACRRAGLPEPSSPNHHLRRTFGRWAVLGHLTGKPVPLYVVSRWFGHSSVKTTEDYLDMTQDESQEWMTEHGPGRQDDPPPARPNDSGGQEPNWT